MRPFPLLVLLAVVLLALRRRGRGELPDHPDPAGVSAPLRAGQAVVGAVLAALAVVVPLLLVEPRSLTAVTQWWGHGTDPGYGALQMVPELMGTPLLTVTSTAVTVAGWLVAVGLGVWLSGRPGRAVGEAQLAAAANGTRPSMCANR